MTIAPISGRPLTRQESDTLAEREAVIARHLQDFYDVGAALADIRDNRLYRAGYRTFEDYCRQRWGMSRFYAHRLTQAAEVRENLLPMGNTLPATERQARPLAALRETPEIQAQAWQRAVDTAPGGRVTAQHVTQTVEYFRPPPQPSQFATAVADALLADGSYRQNVLMEQYHAVMQRLLAAASAGRDLVRHVAPDEMADLLSEEDGKSFSFVADLLAWVQKAQELRQAGGSGIRRVK